MFFLDLSIKELNTAKSIQSRAQEARAEGYHVAKEAQISHPDPQLPTCPACREGLPALPEAPRELGTDEQAPLHHHVLMHHNQPIQPTEMPAQPDLSCDIHHQHPSAQPHRAAISTGQQQQTPLTGSHRLSSGVCATL